MSVNQILPVNSNVNTSGQGDKANGIVQTQQPQQTGAWILADNGTLYMNGTLVPSGGFQLNNIKADDLLCGVSCNNGGDLQLGSDNQTVISAQNLIQLNSANIQVNSSSVVSINSSDFIGIQAQNNITLDVTNGGLNVFCALNTINGYPSSQYIITYGQSKGDAVTTQFNSVLYPNPEIGQPDITMNLFAYNDFSEWFNNDQYNQPDNDFIQTSSQGFRLLLPNQMVEIEITWQMRYDYDGTDPQTYFCCGLWDQTNAVFVPQAFNWFQSTGQKFKYQTFKTSFTIRADPNNVYIPFYMNQNHNQWLDTEAGGQLRSSIKFKFYQFVTY